MALDEAPPFWWRPAGLFAYALAPIALVWGRVAGARMARQPKMSVSAAVLCIGNFVVGGAGKTPTALALGRAAKKSGIMVGFLSRGYGGRLPGPLIVDPAKHRASDVGDEPLELATAALTVISADRAAGAALLVAQGCDLIIMDDGFQNSTLEKDLNLVVVDAKRGLGNGFTIPAGPLRAPIGLQLSQADAILVVGDAPAGDDVIRSAARRAKPLYTANIKVTSGAKAWRGKPVLAFAGIADPTKLFDTLIGIGADLVETRAFPDHHNFTEAEARNLIAVAKECDLTLVTTVKDRIRMRGGPPHMQALEDASQHVPIHLAFQDMGDADKIIQSALKNAEARRLRHSGGYQASG